MRFLSIASGSSGNSIYAGSADTHILIDAGISNKRIEEGLNSAEISCKDLNAIFVTHEHSDHIQALGVLARKYDIPIYATERTVIEIKNKISLGQYSNSIFRIIKSDEDFQVGDIKVHPFSVYHDAADPVGYRLESGGKSLAVATDMGHFDDYIVNNLLGLDTVLLESNHDVRMLEAGPYPYVLKRRILSDCGHLSNENCGKLLCRILNDSIKKVFLGHLSKENNHPDVALESVRCEIFENACKYMPDDVDIEVSSREHPGKLLDL